MASRMAPTPAAAMPNQTMKNAGMAISAIVSSSPRTIQCHHSGEEHGVPLSVCPHAPDGGGTVAVVPGTAHRRGRDAWID
jgi:hypothetical protein